MLAALLLTAVVAASPVAAVGDTGAVEGAAPQARWDPVPHGTYRPPLQAPVIDPFRPPATPWGPGNRGLEYRTVPGQPVRSIGAGQVVFAGQVGGRLAVTVLHPDGRRSSYSDLASIDVEVGNVVPRGSSVGRAGSTFHLGLREGDRYIDPAAVLGLRRRAVLVPVQFR